MDTRSESDFTTNSSGAPDNITTLREAAAAFENVAERANRCSLQLATFRAHEEQIRSFLLNRVHPAADAAAKDRSYTQARSEEEHGNALLRLKGVNVSPNRQPRHTREMQAAKATDDADLALALHRLRELSKTYEEKRNAAEY